MAASAGAAGAAMSGFLPRLKRNSAHIAVKRGSPRRAARLGSLGAHRALGSPSSSALRSRVSAFAASPRRSATIDIT